jgi:threonylcarbamoyladenosine tRNA methylthiotransferase MtaB
MENRLKNKGYELVPFGEKAELGVINTCTVTNEADGKSRSVIRKFVRTNPEAVTIVVGCYSQVSANEIAMIEGVDYVIGNHDKINFLDYITEEKPVDPVIIRDRISREDFSIGFVGDTNYLQRANLKIQDGCDFMCTFCIIPFARGRARSRDWNDVMTEAKLMLKKGVSEVVLTGVNLGTYESEKKEFLELIHALSKLNGLKRLRISSIEPTTIPEEIFDLMADPGHCLMPYLHVPLQSGCDSILKKMRRKYSLSDMSQFFERASSKIPNLCLGTDLMVGFPGESRKDFEKTCETFMDFPFNYCHVFTFSERDGTPAAKMDDQVTMNERRERSAYLRRLSASKRMGFHESQVGRELRVLIENPKNQQFSGYSDNYVKIIVSEGFEELSNKISIVKILEARPEYVVGQWVKFEN